MINHTFTEVRAAIAESKDLRSLPPCERDVDGELYLRDEVVTRLRLLADWIESTGYLETIVWHGIE